MLYEVITLLRFGAEAKQDGISVDFDFSSIGEEAVARLSAWKSRRTEGAA